MTDTRIALFGANGRMGRAIVNLIAETEGTRLVSAFGADGSDEIGRDAGELAGVGVVQVPIVAMSAGIPVSADVAIDFTTPEGTVAAVQRCRANRVPLVSGTTGLPPEVEAELDALAELVPVVHAPNMSVGVTLLFHLAERAARALGPGWDAEIVEMHHRHKIDAPSGTAVRLAEHVVHARDLNPDTAVVHGRSGPVGARPDDQVGVMTLRGGSVVGDHTLIFAGTGERLELSHRAGDRSIFARGAVRAARWIVGKEAGRYDMADVIELR